MTYEQLQMSGLPSSESTEKRSRSYRRDSLASRTALQEKVEAIVTAVTCGEGVARVLGEVKPPWFVGENTPGLFARQNQRFFRRVLDDLAALGYTVGWGIWGACDVGAPHRRERVFFIANRNIPDATIKRCNPNEIQRGEFTESGDEKNTRRVQESGVQFGRVCGSIPYSARDESGEWWQVEPDVGRVVDELPHRVDRLRCLGNAVVPAQAYPIFKAIADFYGGQNEQAGRD